MKYILITMLLILAGCFSSRSNNAEKAPPQVSNGKNESVLPPDRQKVADLEGQLAKAKAEVEERLKQEREKSDASWRFWTYHFGRYAVSEGKADTIGINVKGVFS